MSSNDLAVAVRGVSKKYSIVHKGASRTTLTETILDTLRHPLRRPEKESFWALQDINFEVKKGDVVGIIGKNGAGKSTLLKILSRIVEPTTGVIDLYGPVGSLLEVGTGFHPELTGRENIFLNGAILGMRTRDIQRQFDAIVDFAGVEKFLDTPVKRYSSGMYVRLAFAVAAHLNPEILIVDEVLAVGDTDFQKKCLGKMQEVSQGQGRTVLFVSHNMAAVRQLCTSAIYLEKGRVVKQGPTEGVLELYTSSRHRVATTSAVNEHGLAFVDLLITDADTGARTDHPVFSRDYLLTARIRAEKLHPYGSINLRIFDENGAKISSIGSVEEGITPFDMKGEVSISYRLPSLGLYPGRYSVNLEVAKPHDKPFLFVEDALVFEVQPAIINDAMWAYEKVHGTARIAEGGTVTLENPELQGAAETESPYQPVQASRGEECMPVDVPDVSVVIPCFNQGRFLRDAVDSVLAQRPLNGEAPPRTQIIVVNDGSTDNTRQVAAEYADRITYIELPNSGVCTARNAGVSAAQGRFLHFLDADDWIAPDFFALLLDAAGKNPDISIVFGSCQVTDENKRPLLNLPARPMPAGDPLHVWLTGCYFSVHTPLVPRQLFTAGTRWNAAFKSTEDWDLWIRIAAAGATFLPVPEARCMYRRYGGSKSTRFEQIYRSGTRMLRSHAHHHANCQLCRHALKAGLKNFRNYCLHHSYWYCFGELRRQHGLLAATRYIARTCSRDPRFILDVIRHAFERWTPQPHPQPFAHASTEHTPTTQH